MRGKNRFGFFLSNSPFSRRKAKRISPSADGDKGRCPKVLASPNLGTPQTFEKV
jgi:hypothetical protein